MAETILIHSCTEMAAWLVQSYLQLGKIMFQPNLTKSNRSENFRQVGKITIFLLFIFVIGLMSIINGDGAVYSQGETIPTPTPGPSTVLSISDAEQPEGDGDSDMIFEITRSDNVSDVTVLVNTVNRHAFAGDDFDKLEDVQVTFGAGGVLTKQIAVNINGETRVEGNEFFDVELSQPTGAVLGKASGRGTILNDDLATVTLESVSAPQNEGDSGFVEYTFSVSVDLVVSSGFSIAYNTVDGTATAGEDYEAQSGVLDFGGVVPETKLITVMVFGDTVVEGNETFDVVLGEFSNTNKLPFLSKAGSPQTATIIDDEGATLTVAGGTQKEEGNAGTTAFDFTVSLNQGVSSPFTVEYFTNDNSATVADGDYIDNDGVLNFQGTAGETYTVTVQVNGDTKGEANEVFTFSLGEITQSGEPISINVEGSPQSSTILNDDAGVFFIEAQSLSFGEFAGTALIPVTFSGNLDVAATLNYATTAGSATVGEDYTQVSGTLNFGVGESTQFIEVPLINDSLEETSETFSVTISNPSQYELGEPSTAEVTIIDDDGVATINIVSEIINGDEAAAFIPVELVLDRPTGVPVSVTVQTINGSAKGGEDFTPLNTVVAIAPGETSKIVEIPVIADPLYERNEDFVFVITNPEQVLLGSITSALIKIIEDEPIPTISISEPRVEEAIGGNIMAVFDIEMSHFAAIDIYVDFETQDGTAKAGEDYAATSGRLRFRAGNRKGTIGIPVFSDTDNDESDESFKLVLSGHSEGLFDGPSGGGSQSGTGTIGNTASYRNYMPFMAK